jgi:hypothetical protein
MNVEPVITPGISVGGSTKFEVKPSGGCKAG